MRRSGLTPIRIPPKTAAAEILPDRMEDIQYPAIGYCPARVDGIGRKHHDLSRNKIMRCPVDSQLKFAFNDVDYLLVVMRVFRKERPGGQMRIEDGHAPGRDGAAEDALRDLQFRQILEFHESHEISPVF